jgi:Penicillinase repressor
VLVERSREPFVYRAAHRRESVIGSRVRDFLQDVFDGKADSLVLHLVEDSALSAEELHAIRHIIATSAGASAVGAAAASASPANALTSSTSPASSTSSGGASNGKRRREGGKGK